MSLENCKKKQLLFYSNKDLKSPAVLQLTISSFLFFKEIKTTTTKNEKQVEKKQQKSFLKIKGIEKV